MKTKTEKHATVSVTFSTLMSLIYLQSFTKNNDQFPQNVVLIFLENMDGQQKGPLFSLKNKDNNYFFNQKFFNFIFGVGLDANVIHCRGNFLSLLTLLVTMLICCAFLLVRNTFLFILLLFVEHFYQKRTGRPEV